jgi:uncharacterized protein involved in exopolysaccharide biosynthesis
MATVENVNIEINQKLLDELAALKTENERLKQSDLHLKKWIDELQADKAELVSMLKQLEKELFLLPITQERIHFCLSKHEAK